MMVAPSQSTTMNVSYGMSPQVIFPTKHFSTMNTIVRFFTFFRVMNLQLIHDQEYELWNVSSGDLSDQTIFHNEYNCKVFHIFRVMNLQLIHDQECELLNVSSGDLSDQTFSTMNTIVRFFTFPV